MNEIVFKSVVWKKGDESFRKMPSRPGVGSNPGPFAPESCVLPCAPLHIHCRSHFSTQLTVPNLTNIFRFFLILPLSDPGQILWYRRCRIVPENTTNCKGTGGILCENTSYVTVKIIFVTFTAIVNATYSVFVGSHRCTVVGNPRGCPWVFFCKFFWGLGLWENQGGGGCVLLHF